MKRIILLLFLLSSCLFGQENKFAISGVVTDCQTKKAIPGVTIKLIGRDKSLIETKSDFTGHYVFSNCFKDNTDYIISTNVSDSIGRGAKIKYGICPGEITEKYGYMNSSDKIKFTYFDTLSSKKYDICLIEILGCGQPPTFYFKKNNIEFSSFEYIRNLPENIDTTIDCFVGFLLVHKTWVLEISGHSSSDEDDKLQLSKDRAKKIYKLLVDKGIEPGRLKSKGYSDKYPMEFRNDSGEAIQKSEEETNEKSRRVVFSVLRKDYIPINDRHNKLSGTITDCKTKVVISDAIIKLVGSDGTSINTTSDSNGFYIFDSTKINVNTSYLVIASTPFSGQRYFDSSDKKKFNTLEGPLVKAVLDFCLYKNKGCTIRLPTFFFEKNNSTKYVTDTISMSINDLYQILLDNPTFVIEIGGHSGANEKKKEKLSLDRSNFIRDLLIKKGIEEERLVAKAYTDSKLYEYSDDNDNIVKVTKESEKNQRVSVTVLRKDYISPKAIRIE